jgi:hypothetical protein
MNTPIDPAIFQAVLAANPDLAAQFMAAVAAAQHSNPTVEGPRRGQTSKNSLPPSDGITALQVTFFDNSENGKKPKGKSMYTITLEAWTAGVAEINIAKPQVKLTTELYEYWTFGDKFHQLFKAESISKEYYEEPLSTWKGYDPDLESNYQPFFGMLRSKYPGEGTVYFERQFVVAAMHKKTRMVSAAVLFNEGSEINATEFVTTTSKGNPLSGNAKTQARPDFCDFSLSWATKE